MEAMATFKRKRTPDFTNALWYWTRRINPKRYCAETLGISQSYISRLEKENYREVKNTAEKETVLIRRNIYILSRIFYEKREPR